MQRLGLCLLLHCVLLATLGSGRAWSAPSPPSSPTDELPRLRAWLKVLATEAPSLRSLRVNLEPERKLPLQPAARGLLVEVSRKGAALSGDAPSVDGSALAAQIEQYLARQASLGVTDVRAAVLDVDMEAQWSVVVKVTEQLAQHGLSDVAFHFKRAQVERPFEKTPLDAKLQTLAAQHDQVYTATQLGTMLNEVFARCPRAKQAFASVAGIGPSDRAAVFVSLVDRMLDDPKCVVDAPSVQAILLATIGGSVMQSLVLHLDKKTPIKDRVMAGWNGSWHEVASAGLLDKAFVIAPGQKASRPTYLMVAPR